MKFLSKHSYTDKAKEDNIGLECRTKWEGRTTHLRS